VTGPDGRLRSDEASVVIWLTPLQEGSGSSGRGSAAAPRRQIVQKNKRFETRVLVVEVGSLVDFPNLDPFFHNVFSLFDGKRFDLGLYEAGSTRSVRFDRAGVCYIFCNIHSQMSAAVIVVDTPHFIVLDSPGEFQIPRVPAGRYRLEVWAERSPPNQLRELSRDVSVVAAGLSLGTIQLRQSPEVQIHPNKYGREYDPAVFPSPIYPLP
jgi:plastocyanin